jgi:hypothetical protein
VQKIFHGVAVLVHASETEFRQHVTDDRTWCEIRAVSLGRAA